MRLVEVNTVYSAMFEEIKKRKEDLKALKERIIVLNKDIEDINIRYIDTLYRKYRQQLLIDLERKKTLRNFLVQEALKALGKDATVYNRTKAHLELNGDIVTLDRKDIELSSDPETLAVVKRCFENPFFEETPFVIRTFNDKAGILLGRDSVSINSHGNSLNVKSDDTAYADSKDPHKSFYALTSELLEGVVDIEMLPDYLRSVIESHDHNETVIYDIINDRERFVQDYYANLDGKRLLLVPSNKR